MLTFIWLPLCSKLYQHNLPRPTPDTLHAQERISNLLQAWESISNLLLSMSRERIRHTCTDFTNRLQTYTDSQVFWGMGTHVQAVDTGHFLFSHAAWEQGYLRTDKDTKFLLLAGNLMKPFNLLKPSFDNERMFSKWNYNAGELACHWKDLQPAILKL